MADVCCLLLCSSTCFRCGVVVLDKIAGPDGNARLDSLRTTADYVRDLVKVRLMHGCIQRRKPRLDNNGKALEADSSINARPRYVCAALLYEVPNNGVVNRNRLINLVGPISIGILLVKPGQCLYRCTVESTSVRKHSNTL